METDAPRAFNSYKCFQVAICKKKRKRKKRHVPPCTPEKAGSSLSHHNDPAFILYFKEENVKHLQMFSKTGQSNYHQLSFSFSFTFLFVIYGVHKVNTSMYSYSSYKPYINASHFLTTSDVSITISSFQVTNELGKKYLASNLCITLILQAQASSFYWNLEGFLPVVLLMFKRDIFQRDSDISLVSNDAF